MSFRNNAPKYAIYIVLVFVFNLLLAACGNSDVTPTNTVSSVNSTTIPPTSAPNATTTTSNAQATITWSFWGDAGEVAVNNKLVEQFEKFNPNIKVITLHADWQDYFNKIDNEWVGNKAPDVMFMAYIPTYASKGILENLSPYIARDGDVKPEDFYPNLLIQHQYNGQQYSLPRDNDTKVVYVNLKLLKEAGLTTPKAGWTWQDLRDYSKKLTKRDEKGNTTQYGYAFEVNEWWQLWVWQNGGEVWDSFTPPEPPRKTLIDSPEANEAIQFFADLINVDKVTPSYEVMSNGDNNIKLFTEGKVAMVFGNHSAVPAFSKNQNLEWDVVPLPMGKKRVNVIGGAGYAINHDSKNKEAAWQFLKYLSSELGQGFFMETGLVVPSRQSIREDNIYVRNSKFNWQVFVEETRLGHIYPEFRSSNKLNGIIDQTLAPVWQGKMSVNIALATLPNILNPLLAKS
ncbi:MAG: sugar ABC transporter substrate-binding protein [Chloroflexi bacterium]|uniref:Sugar ABC transporter substrate-binding protein n=1 Tax=Candidatus Chlorohelix allophototropha TaxID=3003348 RepID=A0A8T7LT46_9CHLR|nr:sugar ABC transporter substrate-binding protein [Chloroflexota bacterium]WJW67086.1 sugar ABC transporter substrate-binding protein [Chloroflexota bacterium L227-S17]